MATNPDPNHHIVIAAIGERASRSLIGFTAVTAPLTWNQAQEQWDKLEKERRDGIRRGGLSAPGHVLWFAVRGVSDPAWANLISQGYRDARDRNTGRPAQYGDRGRVKAAKRWARNNGYKGAGGGWIYSPDGKPHTQGWDSLALELIRKGYIAQGSDGAWYILDLPLQEVDRPGHRPTRVVPDQVPHTVPDSRGNRVRVEGVDRCACGCKYWENDKCIDCGSTEPVSGTEV